MIQNPPHQFQRPSEKDDYTIVNSIKENPPKMLTVVEASMIMGQTDRSIRKLIYSGELGVKRINNRISIPLKNVLEYMETKK